MIVFSIVKVEMIALVLSTADHEDYQEERHEEGEREIEVNSSGHSPQVSCTTWTMNGQIV